VNLRRAVQLRCDFHRTHAVYLETKG
jgi:hypothetical protein